MTDWWLLTAGWALGWLLLWRIPRLHAAATSEVTRPGVVIPARDEERSLPTLLRSLRAQTLQPLDAVVVDDESSDATASIAEEAPDIRVLPARPLPPGWAGKPWACRQGADEVAGDRLVFLDADVQLAPEGLAALVAEHERFGGLLSVQPHHRPGRALEWLSLVFNIVAFMGVGTGAALRRRRARAAFGPCLVCRREDYDRVGGHDAVRGEVVEDVALGRHFADAGFGVRVLGGGDLVSFRMYPGGIGQLIEGWSKNMAAGAASTPLPRALGVFVWVAAALLSGQLALWALVGWGSGSGFPVAAAYLAFAAQVAVMGRQVGTFPAWTALAYPVFFAFFVVVFARSLRWTLVARRVRWRGREIPLGGVTPTAGRG